MQKSTQSLLLIILLAGCNTAWTQGQDYEGGKYHASEFLTIAYPMDDALDASKTAIQDAVISWGRISGWLPWMMTGQTIPPGPCSSAGSTRSGKKAKFRSNQSIEIQGRQHVHR